MADFSCFGHVFQLILAAVWYCLNHAQDTNACYGNVGEVNENEHKRGQVGRNTGRELDGKCAEAEAFDETDNYTQSFKDNYPEIKKYHQDKDSSIAGQSDRNYKSTSQISQSRNHVNTSTEDPLKTKSNNSQNISNDKTSDHKEYESVTVKARSNFLKALDKNIQLHRNNNTIAEETIGQSHTSVNNSENDLTVIEFEHQNRSPSVQKLQTPFVSSLDNGTNKKRNEDEKDNATEVEIISIDDDSNDSANLYDEANINKDENLTDINEEKIEEKEPDYFDMDCDEIDDDYGDEEEYEDITNDEDKSVKPESDINTSSIQKDADVTIISDDEDDCEAPLNHEAPISSIQSSKSECYKSNLNKSQENPLGREKLTESVSTKSKRKQSFTNIKEDFSVISREKIALKIQEEGLSEKNSPKLFCPVMEHLDSMSVPTLSKSEKKLSSPIIAVSDECPTSDAAAAVLGLLPVKDIHKTVTSALIATDKSTTKLNIPTITSTQSVHVSSGLLNSSISSLAAIQNLKQVPTEPSHPDSLSHNVSSSSETTHLEGRKSPTSVLIQPQPSTVKSPDVLGSPLRKKRLLDHDKKWHMEPKFSPEQDKYLALPGGVEGNSVLTDWRQPGNYTSVSEFSYVPSIGIEKVDSDYNNYQSICDENYLVDAGDETDDNVDKSNTLFSANSEDEDEGNGRKRKRDRTIGTKRRGRPRLERSDSNIPSKVIERGKGPVRGRGKGPVRGKRGRPPLRNTRGNYQGAFVSRSKTDRKDASPSKFTSLRRDSRGRKIGFYSIKKGRPKNTKDTFETKFAIRGVKRGRGRPRKHPVHNNIMRTSGRGKTSTSTSAHKEGKIRKKGARRKILEERSDVASADDENQDSDIIVID